MENRLQQSPCVVASLLIDECTRGTSFNVKQLNIARDEEHYDPPTAEQASICLCNRTYTPLYHSLSPGLTRVHRRRLQSRSSLCGMSDIQSHSLNPRSLLLSLHGMTRTDTVLLSVGLLVVKLHFEVDYFPAARSRNDLRPSLGALRQFE